MRQDIEFLQCDSCGGTMESTGMILEQMHYKCRACGMLTAAQSCPECKDTLGGYFDPSGHCIGCGAST